jgi:diguanylate cyclase (GGDEF)-like protein
MLDNRVLRSPVLVLLAGLLATAVAEALIYSGLGTTPDELTRAAAIGLVSSCGAASMATLQRAAHHRTSQSLSQAQHDANHDALTGLANRSELHRHMALALRQARTDDTVLGVLFLDLDRFKVVNDSLGHDAGDELLKIVADRLRSCTRSTDLVARVGGDEFVVMCRGLISEESVVAVARQILKRFTEPVALGGRQQLVSTSVGIATVVPGGDTRIPEEIVRDADAAMYRAKRDRTGFAVFDEHERSILLNRLAIERDLNRALTDHQLEVHYQPVIDVAAGGRIHGFEALVRWRHPDRGLLSPGVFIPVAHDAGMMTKIGELVLREACAQAAAWNHLLPPGAKVKIGVNVAEQQLIDTRLPSIVRDILAWSGLDPNLLLLEITEDVMVEHLAGLDMLHDIRAMGVGLAIDDFGTGQSSLSYLRQFDMVTTLKIDQSFVRDMNDGAANRAIVEAIVTMAKALDLSIVAEGVEQQEQVDALLPMGVGLMQGYLFSAPRPIAELATPGSWPLGSRQPARR